MSMILIHYLVHDLVPITVFYDKKRFLSANVIPSSSRTLQLFKLSEMAPLKYVNDLCLMYINELGARVVAESGIPTDRYHLGKLILQCLKDAPNFVSQIDGATGETEINCSVLQRSVQCALSLKHLGLKTGDVMVLMAPSHVDLVIPFYAALYIGVSVAALDMFMDSSEILRTFNVNKPKIVFCHVDKTGEVKKGIDRLGLECDIITFDEGGQYTTFQALLNKSSKQEVRNFKPTDFDTEKVFALLIATSGTTAATKAVAMTHKNFASGIPYVWTKHTQFPTPSPLVLVPNRLQWLTALMQFVASPILRFSRLQCSIPHVKPEVFYNLINKYKPTFTIFSTPIIWSLIKSLKQNQCDFTCFETLQIGGALAPKKLMQEIKKLMPSTDICETYGLSEIGTLGFINLNSPPNSSGIPIGCFQYRLVDIDTEEDISEPNINGELWLKGPSVFKEYYNDPVSTAEAFAEAGWFKTGDLFYRDENWHFYFVDRIKLMLKYNLIKISTLDIEAVIRQHPSVQDAVVVGIPEPILGELPAACVVLKDNCQATEREIKELVKGSLSDAKQLRGGVVFIKELPLTSTTKVDRRKIKDIVIANYKDK